MALISQAVSEEKIFEIVDGQRTDGRTNGRAKNWEAEAEGTGESEKFVCFNPSRVVKHRHYDIGTELQSTCSEPPVETSSILLQEDEYLQLYVWGGGEEWASLFFPPYRYKVISL